jgi:hypothetical protein
LNPSTLELGNRAEHAGDEPSGGCRSVDAFAERHERHAAGLPLVEQQHEMPKVSAETIKAPTDDRVDLISAHGSCELVERRPTVLRTGHSRIDVFSGCPAARFYVPAEFEQLVLARLFLRTDPRVDSDAPNRGHDGL